MKVSIFANFKMHFSDIEITKYINRFNSLELKDTQLILCPSFVSLHLAKKVKNKNISFCAQNMNQSESGKFTGEISGKMITSTGTKYVLIGHSERRTHYKENDDTINKKVLKALQDGLRPVVCVGENLKQKKNQKTEEILCSQIKSALQNVYTNEVPHITIAYEPVWAIGTGVVATTKDIENAVKIIKKSINKFFDKEYLDKLYILYGGSVDLSNYKSILKCEGITGLLVGGACLDLDKFEEMIKGCTNE
ncbi:MAG: triose-phosphate isomerase [Clostridia bacterium]|nr:triose-phosphate isomerase [Clostridia bacterium]